jgi:hypothetical protein
MVRVRHDEDKKKLKRGEGQSAKGQGRCRTETVFAGLPPKCKRQAVDEPETLRYSREPLERSGRSEASGSSDRGAEHHMIALSS